MTCPYCHTEYSFNESCFCHPPLRARGSQVSVEEIEIVVDDSGQSAAAAD